MRYTTTALLALTGLTASNAFQLNQSKAVSMQLQAVPTPFIISGMYKKYKEEQEKKNQKLVTDDEILNTNAPGLKVGSTTWKWPALWPYEKAMFLRKSEDVAAQMNPMAMAMGGGAMSAMPDPEPFDDKAFWSKQDASETKPFEFSKASAESLAKHYEYFLGDGMSVLELGAGENSYLPENLKLKRHVGVSLDEAAMKKNDSLTDRIYANLNDVTRDIGVNAEEVLALGEDQFDAVLITNSIEFFNSPREVLRSAWKALKPGGVAMITFSSPSALEQYKEAQTKWWVNFNSEQHMWVTGSFFQFSAAEGWFNLQGFDVTPEVSDEGPLAFLNKDKEKPNDVFVVQAFKNYIAQEIDDSNPEVSFSSRMWVLPTIEARDKTLVSARLGASYKYLPTSERKQKVLENIQHLPRIYESLIKMDQFAFPFNLQAELATNLILDSSFNGSDEQISAMRMGLGLEKPSAEFWKPVGQLTANMEPADKVNLLTYLVPRFGSNDPEQEEALKSFISGLKGTTTYVKSKLPDLSKGDAELLATELLATEVAISGRSTRDMFASWVGSLSESDLQSILEKRKEPKALALAALEKIKKQKKEDNIAMEDFRKRYEDQTKRAKSSRSIWFSERTGKFMYRKNEKSSSVM